MIQEFERGLTQQKLLRSLEEKYEDKQYRTNWRKEKKLFFFCI